MSRLDHSVRGLDPRELPSYSVSSAARCLRIPRATLRSWVEGRPYLTADGGSFFDPPIELADSEDRRLSFNNLVEAHVLRALRTNHGVRMKDVRVALSYAQKSFGIDRLLLHEQLRASPGNLFLERYGELVNLTRSGQLAMKGVLDAHLRRLVHGKDGLPVRFYPWLLGAASGGEPTKSVAIDPTVSFGDPITSHGAVSTAVIADRYDAGEEIRDLARDYGLKMGEVRDAITYEKQAA